MPATEGHRATVVFVFVAVADKMELQTQDNLGAAAEEKNELPKALGHYKRAISCQEDNFQYVNSTVRVYAELNQYTAAEEQLKKNMAASPTDWQFKAMYAQLMQRQHKLEEAIEYYRQAMIIAPDNGEIAESLGYCYVLSGMWEQAAAVFESVANACPDEKHKKEIMEMTVINCSHSFYKVYVFITARNRNINSCCHTYLMMMILEKVRVILYCMNVPSSTYRNNFTCNSSNTVIVPIHSHFC
jgi:tetratricopeptide (TPR) repeat protein